MILGLNISREHALTGTGTRDVCSKREEEAREAEKRGKEIERMADAGPRLRFTERVFPRVNNESL